MCAGDGSGKVTISIPGTSFAWAPDAPDTLHNMKLNVQRGQLVMVVGEVGSGKSSLLASILGEMHQNGGSVSVQGSVAYTAQVYCLCQTYCAFQALLVFVHFNSMLQLCKLISLLTESAQASY